MKPFIFAFTHKIGLITAGLAIAAATLASPLEAAAQAEPVNELSPEHPASDKQIVTDQLLAQSDDGDDDDDDGDDDDDDGDDDDNGAEISQSVVNRILQTVAQEQKVSTSELRVLAVRRETWSDGCLGLGGSGTACTQALVPGWLAVVARGDQLSVYRTNESGSQIAFDRTATEMVVRESTQQTTTQQQTTQQQTTQQQTTTSQSTQTTSQSVQVTQQVRTAVFQAIAQRAQVQTTQLRIIEATRQTWSDSCLGLGGPAQSCAREQVRGWRVVAASGNRVWVYRTNEAGSQVVFDEAATRTLTARLTQTQNTQTTQVSFRDVASNYWAANFISELARRDIIAGFPDGLFRPEAPVTKAQFAAMLRRAFDRTMVREAVSFQDISTSYWAYTAIREAYMMGFLGVDDDNEFNPTQNLTRLDILTALARGLNYSSSTSTTETVLAYYSDAAAIPANVRGLVAALTEQGVIVNYPNVRQLNLSRVATRAEVCSLLYQALVSTGQVNSINSSYIVQPAGTTQIEQDDDDDDQDDLEVDQDDDDDDNDDDGGDDDDDASQGQRQNCNQGIGNGAEGCDPGNSQPRGGSNDEGGRTPGNR